MYALLRERLPETAIVSIAHRQGVAAFHSRHVALGVLDGVPPRHGRPGAVLVAAI